MHPRLDGSFRVAAGFSKMFNFEIILPVSTDVKNVITVQIYWFVLTLSRKRQLQNLAGSLNRAAGVVYGGRVFLSRILDTFRPIMAANHKCVLAPVVRRHTQGL